MQFCISSAIRRRRDLDAPGRLGPLPARLRHGRVELVPETVKDAAGSPSQPFKPSDTAALRQDYQEASEFSEAFRTGPPGSCLWQRGDSWGEDCESHTRRESKIRSTA